MADGKIQVIMDKDDLQPLANSIKLLANVGTSTQMSLTELKSAVDSKIGGFDTCSLAIRCEMWSENSAKPNTWALTRVIDDCLTVETNSGVQSRVIVHTQWYQTFTDVACGGIFVLSMPVEASTTINFNLTNVTLLNSYSGVYWFMITANDGETAVIAW